MPSPILPLLYGHSYVDSVSRPVTQDFEKTFPLLSRAMTFSDKAKKANFELQQTRAELAKLREKPDTTPEELLKAEDATKLAFERAFVVAKMTRMAAMDAEAARPTG